MGGGGRTLSGLLTFLCGMTCGMYCSSSCALFLPFSSSWNNKLGLRSLMVRRGLEWNHGAVQYGFLGHQRVFTCAASGHRGWIVACSHVHKAPSTTREHYGTTPAFLPLHFLFNTKYIFLTPKEPLCHHPWARTHQRCRPISSYTQMCSERKRS